MSTAVLNPPQTNPRSNPANLRERVIRGLLFLWMVCVACPIRYWPINDTFDNTWVFALNYGAAHGLKLGRDLIWTTGPLGYLSFPMDFGNNLAYGLIFQCAVWVVMIAILADVFFRARVEMVNLGYFAIFFSLSAPFYWFNYMGIENLLLAGMLMLLVIDRRCGSRGRYVAALAIAGVIPLIKLTGGMIAAGAIGGFLLFRMIEREQRVWRDAALAAVIPAGVAGAVCLVMLPSWSSFVQYLRGSLEVSAGYSAAMSLTGDPVELGGVLEALAGLGALLFFRNKDHRRTGWFLAALLSVPLLISIKHGFVRQDIHVINFFTFAGVALAVSALALPLSGRRSIVGFLVLLNFGILSLEYMFTRLDFSEAASEASGWRGVAMAARALPLARLERRLREEVQYSQESRIEPGIRAAVGKTPVAFLSIVYSGAALDGLNLRLTPVPQRYSAYTPALDQRNAAWIRDEGPPFLIFDGFAIDHRNPWAETPAMWLEVYRWYDTRLLEGRNLLLDRRQTPRLGSLKPIAHFESRSANGFEIPGADRPTFLTYDCSLTALGKAEQLVFRVPEVLVQTNRSESSRVVPAMLRSPIMGNFLPESLADFAELLSTGRLGKQRVVSRIQFAGPGLASYSGTCGGKLLTTEP